MSTDLEHRVREALRERAQHARLVNPDAPPAPNVVSLTETPTRRRSRRRLVALAAAITVIAATAVVTAISTGKPSHVSTTAPAPTTAPHERGCPFTADQVSHAIGERVTGPNSSTDCYFGSSTRGDNTSVRFTYLPAFACTPKSFRDPDWDFRGWQPVAGLGVHAYQERYSLGRKLIVCNGDQPFGVVVDWIHDDALVAAVALAKIYLNDLSRTSTMSPTTRTP